MQERTEIINQMRVLLEQLIALDGSQSQPEPPRERAGVPVLLTVKECTELVDGLTMNTVRKLVIQNKVSYIRAGDGDRGKIGHSTITTTVNTAYGHTHHVQPYSMKSEGSAH